MSCNNANCQGAYDGMKVRVQAGEREILRLQEDFKHVVRQLDAVTAQLKEVQTENERLQGVNATLRARETELTTELNNEYQVRKMTIFAIEGQMPRTLPAKGHGVIQDCMNLYQRCMDAEARLKESRSKRSLDCSEVDESVLRDKLSELNIPVEDDDLMSAVQIALARFIDFRQFLRDNAA